MYNIFDDRPDRIFSKCFPIFYMFYNRFTYVLHVVLGPGQMSLDSSSNCMYFALLDGSVARLLFVDVSLTSGTYFCSRVLSYSRALSCSRTRGHKVLPNFTIGSPSRRQG